MNIQHNNQQQQQQHTITDERATTLLPSVLSYAHVHAITTLKPTGLIHAPITILPAAVSNYKHT